MMINSFDGSTNLSSLPYRLGSVLRPAIKKAGWTPNKIVALSDRLQAVLRNFNGITKSPWNPKIIIRDVSPDDENDIAIFDRPKKTICVYLQPGPEIVLALAPAFAGLQLVEFIYQVSLDPKKELTGLRFKKTNFHELSNSGFAALSDFYAERRGLIAADSTLHDNFFKTANEFGMRTMKSKMAYLLQGRETLPGTEIPTFARELFSDLQEESGKPVSDPNKINIFKTIAHLAMAAALAGKTGQYPIYRECRQQFRDVFAVHLGRVEFAIISSTNVEYYQRFPLNTMLQLELSVKGFTLAFDHFVKIFEDIYDSIERV